MDKKYTVFVSSTQQDLREEREAVAKAILELGHIPIGMEMFSAADEQQWELIRRQIDQSDYYIVIIAHRYGSMAGEVSYTEREFDYAATSKIPTLGFIITEDAPWPADQIEKDEHKRSPLNTFKEKVKGRMVSFWRNADQLNTKVTVALSKQMALTPRPGWIRTTDTPGPEALTEMVRLSKENDELRRREADRGTPRFEIMFACLRKVSAELRAQMIVLVHYEGSPIYLPSHRCTLILDCSSGAKRLERTIMGVSPLIQQHGEDLQIDGSGYIDLVSVDTISAKELGDGAQLSLEIRLKSDFGIMLSADISAPDWRFGEPGLDLDSLL